MAQSEQRPQPATVGAGTHPGQPTGQPAVHTPGQPGGNAAGQPGVHSTPASAQAETPASGGKSTAPKGPKPSEDEIRRAKSVIASAKAHGVKLASVGSAGSGPRISLPNGEPRQEYIRRRWKDGASRKLILAEIQSAGPPHDKCTYQIVFSATKNLEGGPEKEVKTESGEKPRLVPRPATSSGQAAPASQSSASTAAAAE
jgi:hypothetical protein